MRRLSTQRLFLLACLLGACGQVRHGEGSGGRAGAAQGGSFAQGGGGTGTTSTGAGAGGSGISLGGSILLGEAGAPATEPTTPVPLSSTQQCDHDFLRVDQLPDTPLYFAGVLDGVPTEAHRGAEDPSLPYVGVFRFGTRHVEAVGLRFVLSEAGYDGSVHVGAADCVPYGSLFGEAEGNTVALALETAAFRSTTYSSDGYTGVTIGTLHAEWVDQASEQRVVLTAEFALEATMPDARVRD